MGFNTNYKITIDPVVPQASQEKTKSGEENNFLFNDKVLSSDRAITCVFCVIKSLLTFVTFREGKSSAHMTGQMK